MNKRRTALPGFAPITTGEQEKGDGPKAAAGVA
jgi:hypothetical protein